MSGRADPSRADRHSRAVALLKVVLPLAALAILSTLFLLSRAMAPEGAVPFADKEIQDRLRDQQITGPFFSGSSADGDQISFSADTLKSPEGRVGINRAEGVRARIVTAAGATYQLSADAAELDIGANTALLDGNVTILTSQGYRLNTAQLTSGVSNVTLTAPGKVTALGPIGTLDAGAMTITSPDTGNGTQMLFTEGVKLVYDPN
ncbi:hypothetical protein KDD17_14630 [Sulfitobacter albidus]|uniref:LPS export ABC transporter periplasmic protein LptC n=1 Tax=Sulfitobacter albidus TaxID=2829501 RepID=A0A975JCX0_9RHOB|nr:hypothetical protein [Sulfitobacter albidus]QUJ76133.1 hypothetical protein KDD17_14630 [Sulfitobacter albidus]